MVTQLKNVGEADYAKVRVYATIGSCHTCIRQMSVTITHCECIVMPHEKHSSYPGLGDKIGLGTLFMNMLCGIDIS